MVNLSSVILVSGLALGLFFSKDIIAFLNSLKGFGQLPEGFGELPEEGLIPAIPDVLFGEGTTKQIQETVGGVQQTIFDLGVETRKQVDIAGKTIFDLGVETRKQVDLGIVEAQKTFEQTGQAIFEAGQQTRETIFQAGVETAKAVEATRESIFQAGVETQKVTSQIGESIFQAGVATREAVDVGFEQVGTFFGDLGTSFFGLFGGQTAPKMILTQEQITDPTRGELRFG